MYNNSLSSATSGGVSGFIPPVQSPLVRSHLKLADMRLILPPSLRTSGVPYGLRASSLLFPRIASAKKKDRAIAPNTIPTLDSLPKEIIAKVMGYLSIKDLAHLSGVNHHLRTCVKTELNRQVNKFAQWLRDEKIDPNHLLLLATEFDDIDLVYLTLSLPRDLAGIKDVDINSHDEKGMEDERGLTGLVSKGLPPLIRATFNGYLDIARLLISHGADLDVKCDHGHTALRYAIILNHPANAELLIKKNHKLNNEQIKAALSVLQKSLTTTADSDRLYHQITAIINNPLLASMGMENLITYGSDFKYSAQEKINYAKSSAHDQIINTTGLSPQKIFRDTCDYALLCTIAFALFGVPINFNSEHIIMDLGNKIFTKLFMKKALLLTTKITLGSLAGTTAFHQTKKFTNNRRIIRAADLLIQVGVAWNTFHSVTRHGRL